MRMGTALVAGTLFALLLDLPTAGAFVTNPTSNDANSFTADILAPPTGLTAACGTTITLDWTATVDTYATGHRVFRATTPGGPYSQIAQITPRTTVTYDDTPAAGTYYYVVRAFYLSWESVDSNEAEGRTSCTIDATFYLHNNPTPPTGDTASQAVLPHDGTVPTASVLYNYDNDRDGDSGLLLAKGSGLSETDPSKHQMWSVSGPLNLDGSASLTLWSAIKSFDTTKRGVVLVALLDCLSDGSGCNTITTGSLDLDPWDTAGSGTWVEKTIDLGTVTHTITAARTLRVKIVVGPDAGDSMWFAYDTTSYDSHLQIGP